MGLLFLQLLVFGEHDCLVSWAALYLTAVCIVLRLSLLFSCFFLFSASIRALEVTFSCIYEFVHLGVGRATLLHSECPDS